MQLAEPQAATTDRMTPEFVTIRSVKQELEHTFTLVMDAPGGRFEFAPGQFTMLYAYGVGEVPISISGDPSAPEELVLTIRRMGAVTNALTVLQPGDSVGVRGPFGEPWPVAAARGKDLVVVAGGIGLAPLRPVLYQVLADRDAFERVILLYGARSPSELLFLDEISEWRGRLDMTVMVTVDYGDPGWHGSVGVVTKLINRAPFDPDNAIAFVCGPEIMMRFTKAALESRALPEESIYISMERNMKCGIGLCGHCQFGPYFVCYQGPIFSCGTMDDLCWVKEV